MSAAAWLVSGIALWSLWVHPARAQQCERPEAQERELVEQLLTLSMVAYQGQRLHASPAKTEATTADLLRHALASDDQEPIQEEWDLVWGPASVRKGIDTVDAGSIFVVQHRQHPGRYAIVLRGTNMASAYAITRQVLDLAPRSWTTDAHDTEAGTVQVASGTYRAMEHLLDARPCTAGSRNDRHACRRSVDGYGQPLVRFLAERMASHAADDDVELIVTGHSFGGTVSGLLALTLADEQNRWDPRSLARLEVWSFASQSAGNQALVDAYQASFGSCHHRVANSLDPIPLWWNDVDLQRLPQLYERCPNTTGGLGDAMALVFGPIGRHGYVQPPADPVHSFEGRCTDAPRAGWEAQMNHQHVAGYIEAFGLEGRVDYSDAAE